MGGAEGCRGHVQVSFIPRGASLGSGSSFVRWRKNPVLLQIGVSTCLKDGGGFLKKMFISLAVPGLSCSMQDLRSLLLHAESFVEARRI